MLGAVPGTEMLNKIQVLIFVTSKMFLLSVYIVTQRPKC